MRPLLSAVLLAAAPAYAADPPPDAYCRYTLDVTATPRSDCAAAWERLEAGTRELLLPLVAARRRQVRELVAAVRAAGPSGAQAVLADPRWRDPARLNARTLSAWYDDGDPVRADPAVLAAARLIPPDGLGGGPPSGRDRAALARELSLDGRLADGADGARAMDGALARRGVVDGEAPVVPGGLRAAPAEGRVEFTPVPDRRSDLELHVPEPAAVPAPAVEPLVAPGRPAHESLLRSVDARQDACADFFQYACGTWLKENPLDGAGRNGRFDQLVWRNLGDVRVAVENIERAPAAEREPDQQRLADYYRACNDEKSIERAGTRALERELAAVRAATTLDALADAMAASHLRGVWGPFGFGSVQDARRPQETIAALGPGGIGMPRSFFVDAGQAKMRDAYREHIEAMFRALGEGRAGSRAAAAAALRLETALAAAMLDEEAQRDPLRSYHRVPLSALEELAPSFPWRRYFAAMGAPAFRELNASQPEHLRAVETLLKERPLEEWRSYLAWRLLAEGAGQLPERFRKQASRFEGTLWGGGGKLKRPDACLRELDAALPGAMGEAFVGLRFNEKARAAMEQLAESLRVAVLAMLREATWLTPATRQEAAAKARAMTLKIGSQQPPERYDGLHVVRNDAFGNMRRAQELQVRRSLDRIGQERDRGRWQMSAHQVNAYYNAQNNEIVFPAGILQPPFFDLEGSPAVNFGAIGSVIGHEIVHGFDDEGCKFDGEGSMREWWTPEDAQAYMARAGAFVQQYSAMPQEPGGSVMVNGRVSLGENIADNGGLRAAYSAYMSRPEAERRGQDGFSAEQSFFLGFARVWCGQQSSANLAAAAAVSPHAPNRVRVNATVSNMPEFREAFRCREGAPMVNPAPNRVW